jgi:hypothetical protein
MQYLDTDPLIAMLNSGRYQQVLDNDGYTVFRRVSE